ncbi:hypothetical protein COEREDRAFT_100045 [Coemansia reversa NRRL 1564]|uniref:TPR-like protein n=1 Tax=Coemansia reversa (strain ATCC 12441 / NRRL 1564) TaxID=763665 RepID=A0A2G5B0J7_COERN|nr:hypothetical protein COEREDRAFT_100045 [Coemansia reversa NRRL 1564]|eukprot:PIA12543.1 hypothetical protein COEREDRAFT_100045 [Coemansia reversa NRRL 1564]
MWRTLSRLRVPAVERSVGRHGFVRQRRRISTFHMDNTPRGKLEPYMNAIKIVSSVAGLVILGVGGFYMALNNYLDRNWPVPAEVTRKETRKLLRGATMREHVAPDPRIAYVFLLRALEQIYKDGELGEDSETVQEIVVRLANAAARIGERRPAENMLDTAWNRVVDDKGRLVRNPVTQPRRMSDEWRYMQVCRVAEVLGPLQMESGKHEAAIRTYGTALRAAKYALDQQNSSVDEDKREDLLLKHANYVTSLGEAFALSGDVESAKALLMGVLKELKERQAEQTEETHNVADMWTCLDAVVMLDLAQVAQQSDQLEESKKWANSGVAVTRKWPGVSSCDNCQSHLLAHLAHLAELDSDHGTALNIYSSALSHAKGTGADNAHRVEAAVERLEKSLQDQTLKKKNKINK